MQRKAYGPGVAALLAAVLVTAPAARTTAARRTTPTRAAAGAATQAAQPGRYATLPEPCGAVDGRTLEELLPGLAELTDEQQREKAYAGEATLTYDTDRKVGCRWKVESLAATDRLLVDFERVVSYDNAVSDDAQAEELFARKQEAAQLPEPTVTGSGSPSPSGSGAPTAPADPGGSAPASGSPSSSASPSVAPSDLQPRVLEDLGDEAFLDDALDRSGSTAQERTVTVAFRTSNVIVTVEYAEQPVTVGAVPDSKEMQDRARKLAAELSESLGA